jgi:putative endonuclease
MYSVYVLHNKKHGKIYIGQTKNLKERLQLHNEGSFKGYTARFDGSWVVIYSEEFSTRGEALVREKQLKSFRGREFVKKFILHVPPAGGSAVEQ